MQFSSYYIGEKIWHIITRGSWHAWWRHGGWLTHGLIRGKHYATLYILQLQQCAVAMMMMPFSMVGCRAYKHVLSIYEEGCCCWGGTWMRGMLVVLSFWQKSVFHVFVWGWWERINIYIWSSVKERKGEVWKIESLCLWIGIVGGRLHPTEVIIWSDFYPFF